jgi:ABC-2 type transport system permease protein
MLNALLLFRRALARTLQMPGALCTYAVGPVLLLWLLCQLFGSLPRATGFPVTTYLAFVAPTLIVAGALPSAVFAGMSVRDDRNSGMLEYLLAAPVAPASLLVGEALARAIGSLVTTVVVGLVAVGAGLTISGGWAGALALLPLALALTCTYAGLSLAIATLFPGGAVTQRVGLILLLASVVVSDLILPAVLLPNWLLTLAHLNPLSYAIHGARALIWPHPSWQQYGRDLLLLTGTAVVSVSLAVLARAQQPATGLAPASA